MMTYYFSEPNDSNNIHYIHKRNCNYLPKLHYRTLIGIYPTIEAAMEDIQKRFPLKQFSECSSCCSNHLKSNKF
ncbi:hypothetical protein IGL78_001861 [Enterococcus sp. DIV1225]|nr:hypothetical protein AQ486_14940 [Enterococcus faecalis]